MAGKKKRAALTAEEKAAVDAARKDKLADLQQRITTAVGELTNSDQWKKWLAFAAKFHNYSFGNTVAIMMQRPDASWVAGFQRWKDLGRHVRKGEQGIAILAPIISRSAAGETDEAKTAPESGGTGDDGSESQRGIYGVRAVYVFDISQTDGPDLDVPEHPGLAPVVPHLLEGEAPEGLWSALEQIATDNGYRVERGPCGGTSNGWTNYAQRLIRVRDDVDDAQATKTLAHEVGHMLMHEPSAFSFGTTVDCRGTREVEAESVAFIVAAHNGMDTSTYTFGYVATWAQRAADLERDRSPEDVVRACGHRIVHTASLVTARTDELLGRTVTPDLSDLSARADTGRQRTHLLREQTASQVAVPPAEQRARTAKEAFPTLRASSPHGRAASPQLATRGRPGAGRSASR